MSDKNINDLCNNSQGTTSSTDVDSTCSHDNNDMDVQPTKFHDDKKNAIPVTLLSGFLGSGKTTLLQHLLKSSDHEMKIAVIVNDMAELNIDSEIIQKTQVTQTKKEVIQLQNGCICCTLRGDLIREINRLQQLNQYDYILIESTGIAEPQQVAESFCVDPETQALSDQPEQMLWNVARLDTCVTIIDAHNFRKQISSLKRFKEEYTDGLDDESGLEEGEKSIAHLLIEQVEFANVILLNKADLVSKEELELTKLLIQTLNPKATILETKHCKIDPKHILDTNLFSMEEAERSPGWLSSLDGTMPHMSETEEYGFTSFVYKARKPFHPARLYQWMNDIFYVYDNWKDPMNIQNSILVDERYDTMTKRFGEIYRSKGFTWIAGRDSSMAVWAHSGRLVVVNPTIPWYVTQPEEEWETDGVDDISNIKSKFDGPHGDRRQEIVFIGINLRKEDIAESLNQCLLSDTEMSLHTYASEGKYFDPLPPWVYHYVEPCVVAVTIRPMQCHKFQVSENVVVTLSNLALNVVNVGLSKACVQVWLDFCHDSSNRILSSILLATLSKQCPQHSFQIQCPGFQSDDTGGPRMLRVEYVANKSLNKMDMEPFGTILDETTMSYYQDIEVYVTGYVTLSSFDDDNDDEPEVEIEQCQEHDHRGNGNVHKKHKS